MTRSLSFPDAWLLPRCSLATLDSCLAALWRRSNSTSLLFRDARIPPRCSFAMLDFLTLFPGESTSCYLFGVGFSCPHRFFCLSLRYLFCSCQLEFFCQLHIVYMEFMAALCFFGRADFGIANISIWWLVCRFKGEPFLPECSIFSCASLYRSPSVIGVLTPTAALFWSHHVRMEVKPLRLILLDLLYSNEMGRHCFGLCIPYSWYMSQHIQMVFKMATRNGFRHSPYCGHFLTIYLTPWSWGLDMSFLSWVSMTCARCAPLRQLRHVYALFSDATNPNICAL